MNEQFPVIIKKLRESKNLTQKELSEMLGMKTYTTITKWEKGENFPKGKDLKKLAKIFNVTSDYLLGIEKNKNQQNEFISYLFPLEKELLIIFRLLNEDNQKDIISYAKNKIKN